MPKKVRSKKSKGATRVTETPELTEAARTLASLTLDQVLQDGTLGLRQGQQLRRALATAATSLSWDLIPGSKADRMAVATKDVARLADVGAKLLERDLADLLAGKRGEIQEITRVTKRVYKLAADSAASFPTEVEYSYTMRTGVGGLVTRTETLKLNDAVEARNAAQKLENRMEALARLRDQMIQELQHRQRQIKVMRNGLSGFVASSSRVVGELLTMAT